MKSLFPVLLSLLVAGVALAGPRPGGPIYAPAGNGSGWPPHRVVQPAQGNHGGVGPHSVAQPASHCGGACGGGNPSGVPINVHIGK